MIGISIFSFALVGFALLHLGMARHQQDWLKRMLSPRLSAILRVIGLTALIASLVFAGSNLGWSYGTVTWAGYLMIAAASIVALNLNRARVLGLLKP